MGQDKSEFKLIEWMRGQVGIKGEGVRVGIGDDMAVLEAGGETLLITTDTLLEGVHFDTGTASLEQIGYKAIACSLSDCAAMAAVPWVAVAAVSLPNEMSMQQGRQLLLGLRQAAEKYSCPLVGGDTTSWDNPLAITVTMLARAAGVAPVLRSGAQIGDAIMVTGQLGGSLRGKHLEFTPRVTEARQLAQLVELHAMIDISDGLSIDLDHICQQSNVMAILDATAIPISSAAQKADKPLRAALGDGEDFELLFCLPPAQADRLLQLAPREIKVPITRIGRIVKPFRSQDHRLYLQTQDGKIDSLEVRGWEHFK
jgi:thiamine-monophosphate kinase